jgi:hypothetical protein
MFSHGKRLDESYPLSCTDAAIRGVIIAAEKGAVGGLSRSALNTERQPHGGTPFDRRLAIQPPSRSRRLQQRVRVCSGSIIASLLLVFASGSGPGMPRKPEAGMS